MHPFEAIAQRDPGACDGCGARAAVGLQYIAVERNLPLAHRLQVRHGAQRTADEALNFLRTPAWFARRHFTARARVGCTGQHRVFRRHPATALAA